MKRVFTYFLLPVCLCLLVIAYTAGAVTVENELGIYADLSATPEAASTTAEPFVMFEAYLMVINPYNYHYVSARGAEPVERAMDTVHGFACQMLASDPNCVIAEVHPVVQATIDYNNQYHMFFDEPVPVPEDRIVHLATLSIMVLDDAPHAIYLGEADHWREPEHMMIYDGAWGWLDYDSCIAYPSSSAYDKPVFGINQMVVSTDSESWGDVKSLFRQ